MKRNQITVIRSMHLRNNLHIILNKKDQNFDYVSHAKRRVLYMYWDKAFLHTIYVDVKSNLFLRQHLQSNHFTYKC